MNHLFSSLAAAALALGLIACQSGDASSSAEPAPLKDTPADNVPAQAALPSAEAAEATEEAAGEPAAQPKGCCGSEACVQAKMAEGPAACPCQARAQGAELAQMPNCGGDDH